MNADWWIGNGGDPMATTGDPVNLNDEAVEAALRFIPRQQYVIDPMDDLNRRDRARDIVRAVQPIIAAAVRAEAVADERRAFERFLRGNAWDHLCRWMATDQIDVGSESLYSKDAADRIEILVKAFASDARRRAAGSVPVATQPAEPAPEEERANAPFVDLASRWEDLLATQSEVMTTAQRNAWRDALAELRHVLAGGGSDAN